MDRLIQDLLTYSRSARREIQLQPVGLDQLVHGLIAQSPDLQPPRAELSVPSACPQYSVMSPR